MTNLLDQKIPTAWPEREALRETGQFWTPHWLAKAMAAWTTANKPSVLFDPAVGPGTFFPASRDVGFSGDFAGFELDKSVLSEGYKLGLTASDTRDIAIGDFIGNRIASLLPAIISNPPYIRHHRLSESRKAELRLLAGRCLGFSLDGRVGLHVYFLLKCLEILQPGGRLAFLLPADVCEGVSSNRLWMRLGQKYCLEAVITFSEEAAPFPKVDTNALVLLLSNRPPKKRTTWLRVLRPDTDGIV
jgi:adenine-specific DNA-methyltransferase